jgi:lactate racemase
MVEVPDRNLGAVIGAARSAGAADAGDAADPTAAMTEEERVEYALDNPIGSPRLEEIAGPGEKVVIITSDVTRPMPSYKVLPPVIKRLSKAGVPDNDITIVFALGNHRKHTEEEKERLAGPEIYGRIGCIDSNQEDLVRLGTTADGTSVDLFRPVAEADKLICLGNIEFHYFAGYSGGMKAVMPGVSTMEAIQSNHSKMVRPEAKAGKIDGNPVREEIDEVYKFRPVHFIVNPVLDEKKRIRKVFAGDVFTAHREGCAFLDTMYICPIQEEADIVIVTPGGYPKDINLYQAQKALDNSKYAVKEGGTIILFAACTEGFGEKVFERWITSAESPHAMVEEIQRNFELGGHKAAAIGMVQDKADILLVSDFDDETVRGMFMTPFRSLRAAFDAALERAGSKAVVHVMPNGGATLPVVRKV